MSHRLRPGGFAASSGIQAKTLYTTTPWQASGSHKDNPGGLEIGAIVEKGKNTGYTISSLEKNSSGNSKIEYTGRMVSLGGRRFLDIVPQNWDANSYSYVLNVKQSKTGTSIEPRLLRLGTAAYMEFTGGSGEQPLKANLRPAHWFLRVTTDGKKLRLDWMDDEKFRKVVQEHKVGIANALLNDGKDVVITAETGELQKFIADHADDDTLFTEHTTEMQKRP